MYVPGIELVTDYRISNSKLIRVGMFNGIPTIAIVDKKVVLWVNKEEWAFISSQAPRISSYFEKRKKTCEGTGDNNAQVSHNNIACICSVKGRNRVIKFENVYPWFAMLNHSPSPHLTLSSPSVSFNKSESAKLCSNMERISDTLSLMDKLVEVYVKHMNRYCEQTEPLDLSINTNSLINNLFDDSTLLKDVKK